MKNSNRLMLLGGAVGLFFAIAAPAFAEMGMWQKADTNKDGAIDRAEFGAEGAERFKAIDADGDGFITEAEMTAFHDSMRAKRDAKPGDMGEKFLKRFDKNSDGKVTADEWPKAGKLKFEKADANGDGSVTAEELSALRPAHDDGKPGITRVDTDKDGKISLAEWNAKGDQMFAKFDANKDGKITKDEMPRRHKGPDAPEGMGMPDEPAPQP
ncbi:EF-hand domain-containing protein [Dongia sp.]|uniref:EF-hand domain-containing protein n=1 Tax=Dongia sp. TaxID=1977262 RepID=UPI0035ADF901